MTCFTAATALAFATAATQRDFWPSGAVTSTTGILVRTFGNWGHAPRILLFYGEVLRPKPEKAGVGHGALQTDGTGGLYCPDLIQRRRCALGPIWICEV